MVAKGPYTDPQKDFVKGEVELARANGRDVNAAFITGTTGLYNERFELKREPYEIASLIRLLFPTGRRGRPPATEPKRRGRPPKTEHPPHDEQRHRGRARKRREAVNARSARSLTEDLEALVVKLSGECVETVSRINIRRLGGKFAAAFPDLKDRFSYNLLRSILRRHGALEAVTRGERPMVRGKMPEDLLSRVRAELMVEFERLRNFDEEEKSIAQGKDRSHSRIYVLKQIVKLLEEADADDATSRALAAALASPGDMREPDSDPGGHS